MNLIHQFLERHHHIPSYKIIFHHNNQTKTIMNPLNHLCLLRPFFINNCPFILPNMKSFLSPPIQKQVSIHNSRLHNFPIRKNPPSKSSNSYFRYIPFIYRLIMISRHKTNTIVFLKNLIHRFNIPFRTEKLHIHPLINIPSLFPHPNTGSFELNPSSKAN